MGNYKSLSSFQLLLKQSELEDKISKLSKCSGAEIMLNSLFTYQEELRNEIDYRMSIGEINQRTYFMIDEYYRQIDEIEKSRIKEEYELTRLRASGNISELEFNDRIKQLQEDSDKRKEKIANSFNKNN